MPQGTNARHRRHIERARAQGKADGPATVHKMHNIANAASIARVAAELRSQR